jgi:hypothetical protein
MSADPLVKWNLCPIYRLRMDREPVGAALVPIVMVRS